MAIQKKVVQGVKNAQPKKVTKLVRTTDLEVNGRLVRKTESLAVTNTVWRDAKGRFLTKREVNEIEKNL